jgi:hypothetical protein
VNPTESVGKQKIANGATDRFPNERKIQKRVWRKMRGEKSSNLASEKHLSPPIFRQQQAATLTANAFRCKGRSGNYFCSLGNSGCDWILGRWEQSIDEELPGKIGLPFFRLRIAGKRGTGKAHGANKENALRDYFHECSPLSGRFIV